MTATQRFEISDSIAQQANNIQFLFDDSASDICRGSAIAQAAFNKLYEYESQIRKLAFHPHDFIRAEALFHLTGTWERADLLDTALQVALHDPSSYTRSQVYLGLADLATNQKDINSELVEYVLTTLLAALLNEPDWTQQLIAHNCIQQILLGSFPPYNDKIFNRDDDVDWPSLLPYREAAENLDFVLADF